MTGREPLSTVVWHESEEGKVNITSCVVSTKSRGKCNIMVINTNPNLTTLGLTKDDGKTKSALIKVYDFTKGGKYKQNMKEISY